MKKFTLLIVFLVCAIGFSQQESNFTTRAETYQEMVPQQNVSYGVITNANILSGDTSSVINAVSGENKISATVDNWSRSESVVRNQNSEIPVIIGQRSAESNDSNMNLMAPFSIDGPFCDPCSDPGSGSALACSAGPNSIIQGIDVSGLTETVTVNSIEYVQDSQGTGPVTVTVNVFCGLAGANPPPFAGSDTPLYSETYPVDVADDGTCVSLVLAGLPEIDASCDTLWVEILVDTGRIVYTPDVCSGNPATGLNTWIVAPACGAVVPTTFFDLGGFLLDAGMSATFDTVGGGGGDMWTVNVEGSGFGDEVTWELRDNTAAVILSGGPYGNGYSDTQMVTTSNEPLEFYIEAMGTFGDNTPTYTISCGGNVIITGSLLGGDEATESGLVCGGGGGGGCPPFSADGPFCDPCSDPGSGSALACSAGPNSIIQGIDVSGLTETVTVNSIEYVQDSQGTGPVTVTVNVFCGLAGANPPPFAGSDTPLYSETYPVDVADDGTCVSLVLAGLPEIDASCDTLWVEILVDTGRIVYTPDVCSGNPATGLNTWIVAPACGAVVPTTFFDLGGFLLDAGMSATLECVGGGGGCPIVGSCDLAAATPDDATSTDIWDRPLAGGTCCSGLGPVSYHVYGPFTVDTAGLYTFDSAQTGPWDGYIFLYQDCFDPLDQLNGFVAGDDDGPGGIGTSQMLDVALVTGTDYYYITTGFGAGDFGDFVTTITGAGNVICGTPPTDNDTCADATAVACGDTVLGDTSNNTDQGGNNGAPDEWFSFTGTGTPEFVTISLCDGGTTYDSRLTVYDSCGGTQIATNDDFCGLQSELTFTSDGVSTYYIAVEGFSATSSGPFSLAVTCNPPAANDDCSDAIAIDCNSVTAGSTTFATVDSAVAGNCEDTFDPTPFDPIVTVTAPGVWYTFTDTSGLASDIVVSTCNDATFDTKISVYEGDCGALVCVAANDDNDDCTDVLFTSTVEFVSDGSSTYYILVHGFGTGTGDFNLSLDCTPIPPPNDMIANSIDVDEIGFPYTDPQVAMPAATVEAGTPVGCDNAGAKGVWYNFIPEGDGTATASITTPCEGLFFTVNNGPLAGSYDALAAAFGGAFTTTVITSDTVVILDDDTTGDPNDACDPILNGADLSGKIAIARRGACAFTDKVFAAQVAGAIAVIVVNNAPGGPIVMGGDNADITIPALMLGDVDGEAIIAELSGGGTVNASMGLTAAGFSSVTFYTAPDENAVETDLVLVDYFDNQCVPGIDASIPTVAGQAYYVYVVNQCAVTDIVIDGTNLGVSDNEIEGFVYYPNPADESINLQSVNMIEQVAIFNMLGQKVVDLNIEATNSQISVSHLATGTYVMKVTVNGQVGTYKVIKK